MGAGLLGAQAGTDPWLQIQKFSLLEKTVHLGLRVLASARRAVWLTWAIGLRVAPSPFAAAGCRTRRWPPRWAAALFAALEEMQCFRELPLQESSYSCHAAPSCLLLNLCAAAPPLLCLQKLNDDMDDYWKTAPKKGEKAAEGAPAADAAGEAAAPEAAAEEAAAE